MLSGRMPPTVAGVTDLTSQPSRPEAASVSDTPNIQFQAERENPDQSNIC